MTTAPTATMRALWLGLALTVLVALVPLTDLVTADSLTTHVRDAYPDWSPATVRGDRDAITIYLVAVGALGALMWLWTIRMVSHGGRGARALATFALTAGACGALTGLVLKAGAYDRVVPALYGALGLLPVLAGAAAVVPLWRQQT